MSAPASRATALAPQVWRRWHVVDVTGGSITPQWPLSVYFAEVANVGLSREFEIGFADGFQWRAARLP